MNISPVRATVSEDDQGTVSAAIASIKQKLPFLVDLSVDDRKSMVKIGTKGYSFVKQALDVASQHPGVLPASFDVNEMRNDTQLFAYLTTLQLTLSQLKKQIDDTVMQIGSQSYASARVVYASASSSFAGSFRAWANMKGADENPAVILAMKPPPLARARRSCATRCSRRTGRHPGAWRRTWPVTSRT